MRSLLIAIVLGLTAAAHADVVAARARAKIFVRIAVDKNYRDEWVIYRDDEVTAFLDFADRCHPRRNVACTPGPAHVLVVPNVPREHIGRTFESEITADDLAVATRVMHAAEAIGKRLGLTNTRVYINSPEVVDIGYLHVHLVGDRAAPYPPPLK